MPKIVKHFHFAHLNLGRRLSKLREAQAPTKRTSFITSSGELNLRRLKAFDYFSSMRCILFPIGFKKSYH
jgi:hypothetical protein